MSKLKLVVFTGAGISAESGIPTFRDSDGLWANHKIEEVCTPEALEHNPQKVFDFYNQRRKEVLAAEPNAAHKLIAELENDYDVTVITQNIDDLHERGGSTNVLHLHGEITKCRSVHSFKQSPTPILYPYDKDINVGDLSPDGEQLRPHVVFFKEPVPKIPEAVSIVGRADVLVIIGTSLEVYPAANVVTHTNVGTPIFAIGPDVPEASELSPYAFHGTVDVRPNYTAIRSTATEGVKKLKEALKAL